MKDNNERINSINNKVKNKKRQRAIWLSVTASALCLVAVFTVVCSLPILSDPQTFGRDISAYKSDAYYPLIDKLNSYGIYGYGHKYSIFNKLFNSTNGSTDGGLVPPAIDDAEGMYPPTTDKPDSDGQNKYEETTLNQVDGVVEADILKRTTNNVFYLKVVTDRELKLDVYALDGAETSIVSTASIVGKNGMRLYFGDGASNEMYLSADGKILTILTSSKIDDDKSGMSYILYTTVISLDVSDVNNITEIGRKYVSGAYLSSRKVDGKLLVITNFYIPYNYDLENKRTYVPACGEDTDGYIGIEDIYIPDNLTSRTYTVLAEFDENTLEAHSCRALLSYTNDVFVSREHIFVTRNGQYYYKSEFNVGGEIPPQNVDKNIGRGVIYCRTTDIVALEYKSGLNTLGCLKINGTILDRYSMDEKDGVLRVFATTDSYAVNNRNDNLFSLGRTINVSLYCIEISSMKLISSVESFAPDGDEVKSARFDGDTAWVCTALRNTDPVYRFDLTDINNIPAPSKTDEIPGFSTSLIAFGSDMLLGIGSDNGDVKIEMYRQDGESVLPIAKYQIANARYSLNFKAYFIDVEHNLVGLGLYEYDRNLVTDDPTKPYKGNKYLLLRFNQTAEQFEAVFYNNFDTGCDAVRAFYLDNAVYLFGNEFQYISD